MKKNIKLFILLLSFCTIIMANEDQNTSVRTYQNTDIQKVFNIVKTIYNNSSTDYIIDTSWDKLIISKRSTSGFLDITIQIDTIIVLSLPNDDNNSTKIELETFKMIDEVKKPILNTSLTHKLLWNRIDYSLGKNDNWIDCQTSYETILLSNSPLCTIDKSILKP